MMWREYASVGTAVHSKDAPIFRSRPNLLMIMFSTRRSWMRTEKRRDSTLSPQPPRLFFVVLLLMSSRIVTTVLSQTTSHISKMTTATSNVKRLYIVRHGQAMHNPRAEKARANGCTMEEFFDLMREDDVLDSPLTEIGKQQAKTGSASSAISSILQNGNNNEDHDNKHPIELVVASSLSRAIQTADFVYPTPPSSSSTATTKRISLEQFREINGELLNAKRRTKTELESDFGHGGWNFEELVDESDVLWTPEMESFEDAAERGYQGLCWLLNRPENSILLVSHGGILRYMMNIHPNIKLMDGRRSKQQHLDCTSTTTNNGGDNNTNDDDDKEAEDLKPINARFENCELRGYEIRWETSDEDNEGANDNNNDASCRNLDSSVDDLTRRNEECRRRTIVLTQIDH